MATDLEKSGVLIGMSKAQVVQVLGMPDASDTAGFDLGYVVDIGHRTGPLGMGGAWLFFTHARMDSVTVRVVSVHTDD